MRKIVKKLGNSYIITLDPETRELFNIDEDDVIEIPDNMIKVIKTIKLIETIKPEEKIE